MIEARRLYDLARGVARKVRAGGRNPAVVPCPTPNQERHRQILADPDRARARVVFLGDSLTYGWTGQRAWKERFEPLGAVNLGIDGDQTGHVLWRVTEGRELQGLSLEAVVLLIGTNNCRTESSSAVAEGVAAVVSALRREAPTARILLLGLLPRGRRPQDRLRRTVEDVNADIARLDDGGRSLRFLNMGPAFVEPDGNISASIMPDYLHLSPEGYALWAESMAPALSDLLRQRSGT